MSVTTNGELNNNEVCNGTVFLITQLISRIGGRPHVAVTDAFQFIIQETHRPHCSHGRIGVKHDSNLAPG